MKPIKVKTLSVLKASLLFGIVFLVSSCGYPGMKQGTYLLETDDGNTNIPLEGIIESGSYITLAKDGSKSKKGVFSDREGNLLSFYGVFLKDYDFSLASWMVKTEKWGATFSFSDRLSFAGGYHSLSIEFSTEKGMSFLSSIAIDIIKNGETSLTRFFYSIDNGYGESSVSSK